MKKREIEEELNIWRFIGTHNARFVDGLKTPMVLPRSMKEWDYLYKMYKENEGK